MGSSIRQRWFKHLDFALLDVVFTILALMLAYYIKIHDVTTLFFGIYRISVMFVVLYTIISDLAFGYLKNVLKRGPFAELSKAVQQGTLVAAGLVISLYLIKVGGIFSRQIFLTFWGFDIILLFVYRLIYKAILNKHFSNRKNLPRLMLVTSVEELTENADYFLSQAQNRYTLKAIAAVCSSDPDAILPKE